MPAFIIYLILARTSISSIESVFQVLICFGLLTIHEILIYTIQFLFIKYTSDNSNCYKAVKIIYICYIFACSMCIVTTFQVLPGIDLLLFIERYITNGLYLILIFSLMSLILSPYTELKEYY